MEIACEKEETFILLNGINVNSEIELRPGVQIQPADTSHIDFNSALAACSQPDDIAVVAAFIPRVTSQLRIIANTPREAAIFAWNSSWDAILLSAIFQKEIGFNIQSDTTSRNISSKSVLRSMHRHMTGFNDTPSYTITKQDTDWIVEHYGSAFSLLKIDSFQTAVECLSGHYWHPNPRMKLALIWAGIEGIFGISSEIRFRISVNMARFLSPDDESEKKRIFELVKSLYNVRSSAVHGGKLKDNLSHNVAESANLLSSP